VVSADSVFWTCTYVTILESSLFLVRFAVLHLCVLEAEPLNSFQVVLIADPVIACDLLRDKGMDKSRRAYVMLNAVSDSAYRNIEDVVKSQE